MVEERIWNDMALKYLMSSRTNLHQTTRKKEHRAILQWKSKITGIGKRMKVELYDRTVDQNCGGEGEGVNAKQRVPARCVITKSIICTMSRMVTTARESDARGGTGDENMYYGDWCNNGHNGDETNNSTKGAVGHNKYTIPSITLLSQKFPRVKRSGIGWSFYRISRRILPTIVDST